MTRYRDRASVKQRRQEYEAVFGATFDHRSLTEPSKQQLRDELAEAVRNTAALPVPRETSEASDER